jgi:hypothetical protein
MGATSVHFVCCPLVRHAALSIGWLADAYGLDGGGVRGVSELHILKVLFGNDGTVQPYKYFDMMCGTSTGGYVIRRLFIRH